MVTGKMLLRFCEVISEELMMQRKLLELSQSDLAVMTGLSIRSIQLYEKNNYRSASLKNIIKISIALESYRQIKLLDLRD